MAETLNYKLYLEENPETPFKSWREKMNGPTDSNMEKIDAVLGAKADSSSVATLTLTASGWVGEESPYRQELKVPNIKKDTNGIIDVSQSATIEQRDMVRKGELAVVGQEDGMLTIIADGEKPSGDIPIQIIILG